MKKKQKRTEMVDVQVRDMVIFKAGTWNGETFTESDLDNMAASFNREDGIPIIVGHSSDYKGHTRIPKFGEITGGLKRIGKELLALGITFNDKLVEWVREGFYDQRSIELSRDNKRILALAMIGAAPPAVKGLPGNDEALQDVALQFSEAGGVKIIEFAEGEMPKMEIMDKAEGMAVADTLKNVSEYCARFLSDVEEGFNLGKDGEYMMKRTWDLQMELSDCLGLHAAFMRKLESIEEDSEEYASKSPAWRSVIQKFKKLFTSQKEIDMDAKKEQEYKDTIAGLQAKVTEFSAKEQAAETAKAAAETQRLADEAKAKDDALAAEVKTFCDAAVKEGRMSPAMVTTDTPIMLSLAKVSPEAVKSFQEKYSKTVVPLGKEAALDNHNADDSRPQVIKDAEAYVKANPKEFSGMKHEAAISRAVYLRTTGRIKFEGTTNKKEA